MKKMLCALAVAGLTLASSAKAAVFDYSYTYHDGTKVSGSFTGDLNGTSIYNLSNISVLENGASIWGGTFYLHGFTPDEAGYSQGGAFVSLIPSLNSFAFTSSPDVNVGPLPAFFDYGEPGPGGPASHLGINGSVVVFDRPDNNSNFSIVARSTGGTANGEVPEPHIVLLFGAALAGLALTRKAGKN
ncbi:PEP-CTERM sorting domain-containing protein [Noviherbaspirillum pedocola]|uniref:Ice-binding protein C-terminal domain-containing protein n=1 Tax=Noviherbaspirillum pedocola TaxID=2801341 RepID=A0A934SXU1_9BURK|nr:PEP-CTERM sorting domain-containing protein [Noviherbaspirillum pedocola]MBK4737315.1 hypothetical protein [Noviherbaspirillum pedocola]